MTRYNIVHEAVLYLMIDITITLTKIPRSLSNRRRSGHSNSTRNSEQLNSNVSRLFDRSDLETSRVAVEFRAHWGFKERARTNEIKWIVVLTLHCEVNENMCSPATMIFKFWQGWVDKKLLSLGNQRFLTREKQKFHLK
jgi:hypothetical protein